MTMRKITQLQLFFLTLNYVYMSTVDDITKILLREAEYSGWVSLIGGVLLGMPLIYAAYRLARMLPNESLAEYGKRILPRFLHLPLMLFILIYLLYNCAVQMRHLSDLIMLNYLSLTPDWVIVFILGFCIWYSVRAGIENMMRLIVWAAILACLTFFVYPPLIWREFELQEFSAFITNLQLKPAYAGSLKAAGYFGQLALIPLLAPYVKDYARSFRTMAWGTACAGLIMLMALLSYLCIFGPDLGAKLSSPGLEAFRLINLGDFIQNIDFFLMGIWTGSVLLNISLPLFLATDLAAKLLRLKDAMPLYSGLTWFMCVLSLGMARSVAEFDLFLSRSWGAFSLTAESIPLLYFVVYWIKLRRRDVALKPANAS